MAEPPNKGHTKTMVSFILKFESSFHPLPPLSLSLSLSLSLRHAADVAYLNLANVLHRSRMSSDAVIPLKMAIEISPDINILHYTLGNVYVVSS